MTARADKLLRGVEVGTKAGYLVLGLAVVWIVWKILAPRKKEGTIEAQVPILPPIRPAQEGDAPPPRNEAEPEGITGGFLMSGVAAQIIDPAEGARVYRGVLSSEFPATIEVSNVTRTAQSVQIEVVIDFYEYAGIERLGVRTRFPVRSVRGDSIERFEVRIDSGNFNGLVFEVAQATAVARVFTNGKLTQSTSFEVW